MRKAKSFLRGVVDFTTACGCSLLFGGAMMFGSDALAAKGLYGGSMSGAFVLEGYPENPQVYNTCDMLYTSDPAVFLQNTTWVYWGYMYLEQGDYFFLKRNFDDGIYLKIEDQVLINDNVWTATISAVYNAPAAGWYKFEVRAGQGSGGVGPYGDKGGFHYWRGSTEGAWEDRGLFGNSDGSVIFRTEPFGWRVSGNIDVTGTNPAYGFYAFESESTSKVFAAPETVDCEDMKLELLGYEVYSTVGSERFLRSSGSGNSVTVAREDADSVDVVWQWKIVSSKISASADATKGAVAVENEWVASDGNFKVTAEANAGYAFAYWQGDVPEKLKYFNPLELPSDAPRSVTAVFGTGVKVSPSDNVAAAIATVATSATAEAPGVVELAAGEYTPANFLPYIDPSDESITNDYMLVISSSPVIVRSASDQAGKVALSGGYATRPLAKLAVEGAALVGVSIANVSNTAVRVEAGTLANAKVTGCYTRGEDQIVRAAGAKALIRDCDIFGNTHSKGGYAYTGALGISDGAEASRCVIYANTNDTSYYSYGAGGVVIGKGRLSNSVVSNNFLRASKGDGACTCAGGISVGLANQNDGVVENCLVANNTIKTSGRSAGGVLIRQWRWGTLINCTVVGNQALDIESGASGVYAEANSIAAFRNMIVCDNSSPGLGLEEIVLNGQETSYSLLAGSTLPSGTGNSLEHPVFENPAAGDYRLKLYSPGRDAGSQGAGNQDLAGNLRKVGAAVDIGAYEIQQSARVQIANEQTSCAAPCTLTIKAGVGMEPQGGSSWVWTLSKDNEVRTTETHDSQGAPVDAFAASITEQGTWLIRVEVTLMNGATVSDELTVKAIGDTAYVSASGSNTPPYDTPDKAARRIDDAIAAVMSSGSADKLVKVVLAAGEYKPAEADLGKDYMIEVPSYVWLVGGGNMPAETVLNANEMRGVKLNPGARLENVKIINCKATGVSGYAWGVIANQATIVNCVLSDGNGNYAGVNNTEPFVMQHGGKIRQFEVINCTGECTVKLAQGALVEGLVVTNISRATGNSRFGLLATGAETKVRSLVYADNRIVGGDYYDSYGVCVAEGAEIADSKICDNRAETYGVYAGGMRVVWNRGGTLRRVKIMRNHYEITGRATGRWYSVPGVYQESGAIDNCLVVENTMNTKTVDETCGGSRRGAGILLHGGSVVNTTVARNCSSLTNDVHGIAYCGGTILNTIVAGNGYDGDSVQLAKASTETDENGVWLGRQALTQLTENVTYTIVSSSSAAAAYDPVGEGVIAVDDVRFKNAARGNYRLQYLSPAKKAGQAFAEVTYDLDGKAREANKRGDLGCYRSGDLALRITIR